MEGYMGIDGKRIPVEDFKINKFRYAIDFPTEPFIIVKAQIGFNPRTNKMSLHIERTLTQEEVSDRMKRKILYDDEWIVSAPHSDL